MFTMLFEHGIELERPLQYLDIKLDGWNALCSKLGVIRKLMLSYALLAACPISDRPTSRIRMLTVYARMWHCRQRMFGD